MRRVGKIARRLLIAFSVVVPTHSSHAQVISLRCDTFTPQRWLLLVSIDTSHKTAHFEPGSLWTDDWEAGKTQDVQQDADSNRDHVLCTLHIRQFVEVTDNRILFGETRTNTNRCGWVGEGLKNPYAINVRIENAIDRNTGVLELASGDKLQCQLLRKAIP
jgi:hypothetical protein